MVSVEFFDLGLEEQAIRKVLKYYVREGYKHKTDMNKEAMVFYSISGSIWSLESLIETLNQPLRVGDSMQIEAVKTLNYCNALYNLFGEKYFAANLKELGLV